MGREGWFWAIPLLVLAFGQPLGAHALAGPKRPAGVPANYVITPVGYFHPSCVRQLAKGESILPGGHVIRHVDGSLENIPGCTYPHYTARGESVTAQAEPAATAAVVKAPEISHSWIEAAADSTSSSYGELSATWIVPPAPTSNDGQTLYFFPGIVDDNAITSIVQPVLGWNADYPSAWGIASWNCCQSGTVVESAPVSVNTGDTILGTIQSTCGAGTLSCPGWNITTEDVTSGQSTVLANSPSDGQTFNYAYSGALEVYNIAQCGDYPPNGATTIYNVALYDNDYNLIPAPYWGSGIDGAFLTPLCNYGFLTATTQITLNYGDFPLSDSPGALTVTVGGPSAATTVGIVETGFSNGVTLTASNLPSGVTASFGTNSTSTSSILTLTAGSAAVSGTYTVTITGVSSGVTESTPLILTVVNSTLATAPCGMNILSNNAPTQPGGWPGTYTSVTRVVVGADTANQVGQYKVCWDANYLYVGVLVDNSSLAVPPANSLWQGEAVEVYLDMTDIPGASYVSGDFQYIVGYGQPQVFEQNGHTTGVLSASQNLGGGTYAAELAIPWTTLGVSPAAGAHYGFDVGVDMDANSGGSRTGQLVWAGTAQDYTNTENFGQLQLGAACGAASPTLTPTRTPSATPSRTPTPSSSATASLSPSSTATPSQTRSATATTTVIGTPSMTPSRTLSPVLSATPTLTASPTPSRTSSPTPSATATSTPVPSVTVTTGPTSQPTVCAAPVLLSGSTRAWSDPGSDNSFSQAYAAGSGSDTALVVRTYIQSGVTISSVTYAGTALTEAAGAYTAYNGYVMQTWWMTSPSASSNALVVNFPATHYPNLTVFAATYSGVSQSSPIGASASSGAAACATSYQSNLTTVGSNSLIDDFLTLSTGGSVGATVSPGTGQTWEELNISGGAAPAAYDDYLVAGSAGAHTLSYSFSYCLSERFSQTIEIEAAPCPGVEFRQALVAVGKSPLPSPESSQSGSPLLAYPNPAPGSWTTVEYRLGAACRADLEVFSLLGKRMGAKDLGMLQPGSGSATLDLAGYPAGIYFVMLRENGRPAGTFKLAVLH